MAQQTAIEWLEERLSVSLGDEIKYLHGFFVIAKEMHKAECVSFAEEWEIRCNEKNMDSKEQLYEEIYNK
jgi:hypothetical protein